MKRNTIILWAGMLLLFLFAALVARWGVAVQDTEFYIWQLSLPNHEAQLALQGGSALMTQLFWILSFGSLYVLRLWMLAFSFGVVLTAFALGTHRTGRDVGITLCALFLLALLSPHLADSAYWAMHWSALVGIFCVRYLVLEKRSARWWMGLFCGLLVTSRVPSGWICVALAMALLAKGIWIRDSFRQTLVDLCVVAGVAIAIAVAFTFCYAGSPVAFIDLVLDTANAMPKRYSLDSLTTSYDNMLFKWAWLPFCLAILLCLSLKRFFLTRRWGLLIPAAIGFIYICAKTARLAPELQSANVGFGMSILAATAIIWFWNDRPLPCQNRCALCFILIAGLGITLGSDSWPARDICQSMLLVLPLLFPADSFVMKTKAKLCTVGSLALAALCVILPIRHHHMFREGKHCKLFSSEAEPVGVPGYAGLLTSPANAAWHQRMDRLSTQLHAGGYRQAAIGAFGCLLDFLCLQKGITTYSTEEFWRRSYDEQTQAHLLGLISNANTPAAIHLCYTKPESRWSAWGWNQSGGPQSDYQNIERLVRPYGYRIMLPQDLSTFDCTLLILPESALTDPHLKEFSLYPLFPTDDLTIWRKP